MSAMLEVQALEGGYGSARILAGVDLTVHQGEVVALLGRNGMGKTTTVRSIMGQIRPSAGRVAFAGQTITSWPPHRVARLGIGLVPEGRQVFANLTVREHLAAFAGPLRGRARAWPMDALFNLFPRLAERAGSLGGLLSGGEQQMLAIARALVTEPRLLILDEATEGLAPLIQGEIWRCLQALKTKGHAILVIDKPHRALQRLADRALVMEKGRIVWRGDPEEVLADATQRHALLGV